MQVSEIAMTIFFLFQYFLKSLGTLKVQKENHRKELEIMPVIKNAKQKPNTGMEKDFPSVTPSP